MTFDCRGGDTSGEVESGASESLGESACRLPEAMVHRFRRWSKTLWAPVYIRTGVALTILGAVAMIGARAQGEPAGTAVLKISTPERPAPPPQATSSPASATPCVPAGPTAPGLDARLTEGAPSAAGPGSAAPAPTASEGTRVVLNTATVAELDRLPGVGPKRAEEIVKLRERLGRFRRLADLLRIRGVGPKTLKKWQDLVVLDVEQPAAREPDSAAEKRTAH